MKHSRRFRTREVKVGLVGIGGDNPIRIQSMTTSNTCDVDATIDQIVRLADAGCEIARVTVQGRREAEACEAIKSGLLARGYTIPLVADIHFYPPAALIAVECVDKVRINPGNYVDKRASFQVIEYTDASYAGEVARIAEEFSPLVERCRKLGKAMRIGTNHGSLSDRIMNRYGDSPAGMVESAFEFARICRQMDFHDIIFSMKSSNPLVMIEAYRLLVSQMKEQGWDYPLHLGVTEAGEGEDGRIKSGVGIGTLLMEGIGDTIRVSLTEDPWKEIAPCLELKTITDTYARIPPPQAPYRAKERQPFQSDPDHGIHAKGSVFLHVTQEEFLGSDFYESIELTRLLGRMRKGARTPDALVLDSLPSEGLERASALEQIGIPIYIKTQLLKEEAFDFITLEGLIATDGRDRYAKRSDQSLPLIWHARLPADSLVMHAACEVGSLLADGLGEGVCLEAPVDIKQKISLSFNLLQACRMRMSKTEYISCPGCGRTLFNLQDVTQSIREKTGHLPGVKIAVMGCIVNGPGEMADADFGYVGSQPGKIDLYKGKERVRRGIDQSIAVDELVELIKDYNMWKEPEECLID